MVDIPLNLSENRTFVFTDSIMQIEDGSDNYQYEFVQNWDFNPNMNDFALDRIDSADPIYTKKSDVLGIFSVDGKNTVDIYDTAAVSTAARFVSSWVQSIADGEPLKIVLIFTLNAPNATTDKKITIKFTGRVLDVSLTRSEAEGVHEYALTGEITTITTIQRGN